MKKVFLIIGFTFIIASLSYYVYLDNESMQQQTQVKPSSDTSEQDYIQLLAKTTQELKKSKKIGGAWRDTEKYIKKGKAMRATGLNNKAIAFLTTAYEHSKISYQQISQQKNIGNPDYLY